MNDDKIKEKFRAQWRNSDRVGKSFRDIAEAWFIAGYRQGQADSAKPDPSPSDGAGKVEARS